MKEFDIIYSVFQDLLSAEVGKMLPLYTNEFSKLVESCGSPVLNINTLEDKLVLIVTKKLDLYSEQIQWVINECAKHKVYFNYHEKLNISNMIIANKVEELSSFLQTKGINKGLDVILGYKKYDKEGVLSEYHSMVDNDEHRSDIIESIFSAYIYSIFSEEKIHLHHCNSSDYIPNFYQYLKQAFPSKYDRTHSLSMLHIDDNLFCNTGNYHELLSKLFGFISEEYKKLNNYSFFSILIDNVGSHDQASMWSLYSDIVLYSEKFIEEKLSIGYFHPDKIKESTSSYIDNLNLEKADFSIANSGFIYRDCFIIADEAISEEKEQFSNYKILVLFQKNERDEDIIPCPACRSIDVRGNSYPTLGVKSWECHNPVCPDKSKYNRGKRYSLASIIKQEAIEDPANEIDKENLSDWRLDVVSPKTIKQIIEYLIKQYSFSKDTIYLYNVSENFNSLLGRTIINEGFNCTENVDVDRFFDSAYFNRFKVESQSEEKTDLQNISPFNRIKIYNGNCKSILQEHNSNILSGAVTSPPYYNAKEYSQWSNIYCYLYDMYNHAREVYRTLKPGAYFVYNIFDYFDNENNIVFSAMGKKRMILGAYIIYLFKNIGFEIQQNVIWYKGHVQGHRSTNQGNNSPYYQAPINCYEHTFCFRKPGTQMPYISFPTILKASPVIKMIKGVNTLGHTAPYPEDIPDLLTTRLQSGIVLDPYSGSFTTARSAMKHGLEFIGTELSKEYCDLGIRLLGIEISQQQQGILLFE